MFKYVLILIKQFNYELNGWFVIGIPFLGAILFTLWLMLAAKSRKRICSNYARALSELC